MIEVIIGVGSVFLAAGLSMFVIYIIDRYFL